MTRPYRTRSGISETQTTRRTEVAASVIEPETIGPVLRPGPSTIPRGQVSAIQRERILSAVIDTVAEVGYARMTVAQVIARGRVSRKTFYEVFCGREDCFLAAFEETVEGAARTVRAAYARESSWSAGIRSALATLLELIDAEPVRARLCVVEALGAGPPVLAYRAGVLSDLAEAIDRGRETGSAAGDPPPLTAEGVVGAVFAVLHTRLLARDADPLRGLLGPLMSLIVLPYLGPTAARRELRTAPRGVAARPLPIELGRRDALAGLDIRLTYRTLTVLSAIAEHPGASNRQVASRAGIADQGQISKLLSRLARLGLISNRGEGQRRGGANAWVLTPRGEQVELATHTR